MPKPYTPRRFTRYLDKPRGFRRDRFVSLRWKIAQDPNGRGVFTSHHMLDGGLYDGEIYAAPGDSHWNDFRFLSQKHAHQGLIYTATVRTALMAALDQAEETAWNRERDTLTEEEFAAAHPPIEFIPAGRGLYTMKPHPEALFDRFGPEPVSAWGLRARFLRETLDASPVIHPGCRLDRHYKTGLGGIFITPDAKLTIDSLARLVEDFWARGEVPYEEPAVDFSPAHPANHQAFRAMIEEVARHWENMDLRARGLEVQGPAEE